MLTRLLTKPIIRSVAIASFLLLFFVANPAFSQIPLTTDSRIRTLVYNPNEVYEIKFYYNYQSFIEFAEDETIEMISIGEAFAWRLTPAGKRLFIRPLEIAAHTNMTIITNKRSYYFDIRSAEFNGKADEDLVYTIRFFYPQVGQPLPIPPQLAAPNPAARQPAGKMAIPSTKEAAEMAPPISPEQAAADIARKSAVRTAFPGARVDKPLSGVIERNPEEAELNFDYSLAGKSDNIVPLKVYDNGSETFFQFANDNLVIPSISIVDPNGAEQILTYTIRDNYVVIPATAMQFTLRLADSLLCIYNNKMISASR